MRRSLLVAASIAPLLLASATETLSQPRYGGGGFRAGGFHGGGFHGGGFRTHGIGMRAYGVRPGFQGYGSGWRGGWGARGGWYGAGFYPRRAWGGYYPYRRYWGGGDYPYWGVASGLATAAVIGAAASYPAYGYPAYPAYEVLPAASGGQCSTPVKICTLYEPAPLGTGCSCRVPGGRARGSVEP